MVDPSFLKDRIYCMSNDSGEDQITDCMTTFSSPDDPFYYPAPLEDAALECGLHYYLFPDGRGFAINFDAVTSDHEILVD